MTADRLYTTIIVDDNQIDRLTTMVYARSYPFLDIRGVFSSAEEAIANYDLASADVLLLDIDMPGVNGLELRRQTGMSPVCIFITSFPDYAVESFQLAALDFLVKPLDKERFAATMQRLHDYLDLRHKAELFEYSLGADSVFIKEGHQQVKIKLQDILYLEALKDYTRIVTRQKKYHVLSVLGNVLREPSFQSFVRIHRSYAVQKNFIEKISGSHVNVGDVLLPVGRAYRAALEDVILK